MPATVPSVEYRKVSPAPSAYSKYTFDPAVTKLVAAAVSLGWPPLISGSAVSIVVPPGVPSVTQTWIPSITCRTLDPSLPLAPNTTFPSGSAAIWVPGRNPRLLRPPAEVAFSSVALPPLPLVI